MSYWIVKGIFNGFEFNAIMFGAEDSVRKYIETSFGIPVSYALISYDVVQHLEQLGFKVYCAPAVKDDKKQIAEKE
jgi:hypothetical protein